MRSIPLAMTLDTLRRGRWTLPGLALAVNALPLVLLAAMHSAGAIMPDDPSQIMIHITLSQVNMWVFGVVVISSQGPASKLFTLPVPATAIVLWRMSLLVVLAALQSVLSTLLINLLFDVNWPVWGPALLLAVSMSGAQAIIWYADKSVWSVPLLAALALVYGVYMKSRYGGVFQQVDHYWREITFADAGFLLVMVALAYLLGVAGVARNRRGEPPLSLGIADAIGRALQGKLRPATPFRSPVAAQFWFEWRKKGWALPVGAAAGLLLALTIWTLFNRDLGALWDGVFVLGACLTVLGFVAGIIVGHNGGSDSNFDLGGFLATRPLTTTTLANILLKTCALSVLLAWFLWVGAYLGVYLVLWGIQGRQSPLLVNDLSWWYYPVTLLAPWVAVTLVANVGLSGRPLPFIGIGCGLFTAWILLIAFGKYFLSTELQELAQRVFLVATSVLCVGATLAAFIAAWRRQLIGWLQIYVAASLWIALTTLGALTLTKGVTPLQSLTAITLASALFALAVAPLATAPLALAWNRNR